MFVTKWANTITEINETDPESFISISPNPSSGVFHLSLTLFKGEEIVEIYNVIGEKVYQSEIDLRSKSKGIYFLRVSNAAGITEIIKVIIE